jgi:hypothetical protein
LPFVPVDELAAHEEIRVFDREIAKLRDELAILYSLLPVDFCGRVGARSPRICPASEVYVSPQRIVRALPSAG